MALAEVYIFTLLRHQHKLYAEHSSSYAWATLPDFVLCLPLVTDAVC